MNGAQVQDCSPQHVRLVIFKVVGRYMLTKEGWGMRTKPWALFHLEHVKQKKSQRGVWQGATNEIGRKPGEVCYLTVFQEGGRHLLARCCWEIPWVEHQEILWSDGDLLVTFTRAVFMECWGWKADWGGSWEKRRRRYEQLFGDVLLYKGAELLICNWEEIWVKEGCACLF